MARSRIAAAAAAVLSDVTSGTARVADEARTPIAKVVDNTRKHERNSDEAQGIALASTIIAECRGQDRGVWLTYVASMMVLTPVGRAAMLKALRAHRDDVKAHGKTNGMASTAAAASTWLSNMVSIGSALNAGMIIPHNANPGEAITAKHLQWGIAHCIAQAREFRRAEAAAQTQAEVTRMMAVAPGLSAEAARAIVEDQQERKRGRKAQSFDTVVMGLVEKRKPTPEELKATIAALTKALKA